MINILLYISTFIFITSFLSLFLRKKLIKNIDIKVSKNIIRNKEPYLTIVHHPGNDYNYFYIDFVGYKKGFKHKKLGLFENETISEDEIRNARHMFRICISSEEEIDDLIKQLQIAKGRRKND